MIKNVAFLEYFKMFENVGIVGVFCIINCFFNTIVGFVVFFYVGTSFEGV